MPRVTGHKVVGVDGGLVALTDQIITGDLTNDWRPVASDGVPSGGTTNQVLKKNSSEDGDADWASTATLSSSNPAALGGAATPGATGQASDAGHIHDTSAFARTTDLAGLVPFGWYTGYWYGPWAPGTVSAGTTGQFDANGRAFFVPHLVPGAHTIDKIGCYVDAAGTSGALLRLGLFANNSGNPGALIVDGGTVDATTTGAKSVTLGTPQAVTRGIVWSGVAVQGAPGTRPGVRYASGGGAGNFAALFGTNQANPPVPGDAGGQTAVGITGAFASTPGTLGGNPQGSTLPIVSLHVAS